MSFVVTFELDEAGVVRLAELIALKIRLGDAIALSGDLGAGKTTLARAMLSALLEDPSAEVPSPTFSLRQEYATRRLTVAHFDFYRLGSPDEALELGLDEVLETGAVIVEWPERAPGLLPDNRFEITLAETADAGVRRVSLRGHGTAAARARRISQIMTFFARLPSWQGARIAYLQGDASTRSYARLSGSQGTALLMDAPRQPDGPPVRDGLPYSRIAHLAEDVRPFSAIGRALRGAGLSAPEILAEDLDAGLMLIEDLGERVYSAEVARDAGLQEELWLGAVDVLVKLRTVPAPRQLPLLDGSDCPIPSYDRGAMRIEVELLRDWYWPALHGERVPPEVRAEFLALWGEVFDHLQQEPPACVLRDFHSPNLLWLPDRDGLARVGIIDFQDAQRGSTGYDLASLLQDARVDVPEALEVRLLEHYLREAAVLDPTFDADAFKFAYAALGAQRNTKILGIFVRLSRRDGKAQYLAHLPRIWRYVERNLRNPRLAELAAWYDRYFPADTRTGALPA
ncbi:MAG: tRNA (adenosine(37)-N6)-threonylcarbamoyltransferase complex ATPase subunit type 1 TsaE [Hyphomicrobiaceae bacterium]